MQVTQPLHFHENTLRKLKARKGRGVNNGNLSHPLFSAPPRSDLSNNKRLLRMIVRNLNYAKKTTEFSVVF